MKNVVLWAKAFCQHYISFYRFTHMQDFLQKDKELRAEFDKLNKKASYGTAGFRDLATNMPYVSPFSSRLLLELELW